MFQMYLFISFISGSGDVVRAFSSVHFSRSVVSNSLCLLTTKHGFPKIIFYIKNKINMQKAPFLLNSIYCPVTLPSPLFNILHIDFLVICFLFYHIWLHVFFILPFHYPRVHCNVLPVNTFAYSTLETFLSSLFHSKIVTFWLNSWNQQLSYPFHWSYPLYAK